MNEKNNREIGKGVNSPIADEELIRRAKDGDDETFDHLHKRYREKIMNYV